MVSCRVKDSRCATGESFSRSLQAYLPVDAMSMIDPGDERFMSAAEAAEEMADRSSTTPTEMQVCIEHAALQGAIMLRSAVGTEFRISGALGGTIQLRDVRTGAEHSVETGARYLASPRCAENRGGDFDVFSVGNGWSDLEPARAPTPARQVAAPQASPIAMLLASGEYEVNLAQAMHYMERNGVALFRSRSSGLTIPTHTPAGSAGRKRDPNHQRAEDALRDHLMDNGYSGTKADAERWLADWFQDRDLQSPAESTLRDIASRAITRWQEGIADRQ